MKTIYTTPQTHTLAIRAVNAQMLPTSPGAGTTQELDPKGAPARTTGNNGRVRVF